MRTDDADAAIERAKRAMVLGRRVSEKTRKKRREEEDDDDATTTRATTKRLALVRDRDAKGHARRREHAAAPLRGGGELARVDGDRWLRADMGRAADGIEADRPREAAEDEAEGGGLERVASWNSPSRSGRHGWSAAARLLYQRVVGHAGQQRGAAAAPLLAS